MSTGSTLTEDALMTIIDFCNEMGSYIIKSVDFPSEAQGLTEDAAAAILDAHDLAHVILGGSRRFLWKDLEDFLELKSIGTEDIYGSSPWPDIRRRLSKVVQDMNEAVPYAER